MSNKVHRVASGALRVAGGIYLFGTLGGVLGLAAGMYLRKYCYVVPERIDVMAQATARLFAWVWFCIGGVGIGGALGAL